MKPVDKPIQALYFPYARSLNPEFLKQCLLFLDQLVFADPLERAVRESFCYYNMKTGLSGHHKWDSIKDDYALLEEEGFVRRLNPFPAVRDYDGLMAQAMLCDLQDEGFMRLASAFASEDYWGILRDKVPPGSLLADAIVFHGTRFWRTPTGISSPRQKGHDYGGFQDFSSPFLMSVAHDYIPVSCGYSVNTNLALLLGQLEGIVPVTDDPRATQLLNLKYARAKAATKDARSQQPTSVVASRTPEYYCKYNVVGMNLVDALLPAAELKSRSFKDIVRFRKSEQESFARFQAYLRELVAIVDSEPWSPKLESELVKLVDSKVVPEALKVRDQMTEAWEKMFGGVLKKAVAAITPTLVASFFAGLSPGQVLTLSCAAVGGALSIALPEITDLWQQQRTARRNGLSFLVRLGGEA